MKEDFFSKLKNYKKELEKILEKKDFSEDVKNLLLSMFYKLENSYDDYFLVKRNCKTKQEYLEKILESIQTANSIQIASPNSTKFKELKENGLYEVDFNFKKIIVLENEFAMLSALLGLNDFQVYVKEEYNLIKEAMPYLLNTAYDMEKIEVLRDFNAWSWNVVVDEIKDININLVYQNLKMALNTSIFEKLENVDIDVIKYIKQILLEKYNENVVEAFIYLIFKISILIYIKNNEEERKRLFEEKKRIEANLNQLYDKKAYVESMTDEKKKLTVLLKKIDMILNNKELLLQEFERRNKNLAEYNKIFNTSHLAEKLQKERKNILNKIDTCNKNIEPERYLKNKNDLQKEYQFLQNINFETENNVYKYIDKLQVIFMTEIFIPKLQNTLTKDELIDCVYELRYYNLLQYNNEKKIKDLEFLKSHIENAKELLVKKMYDSNIINTFSTNEKCDIDIIKTIFIQKIINMEEIYIKLEKKNEKYIVNIFDGKDTLETKVQLDLEFNSKDKIKLNKIVRLFKHE